MEIKNKTKNTKRTTPDQLRYYINFVKNHPQMVTGKSYTRSKNASNDLWKEVARGLNSMRGPSREVVKWKESLQLWKNQLRCRARKHKAHMLATGGDSVTTGLSEFEEMALAVLGGKAVGGINTVDTMGFEHILPVQDHARSNHITPILIQDTCFEDIGAPDEECNLKTPTANDRSRSAVSPETHSTKRPRLNSMYDKILQCIDYRTTHENQMIEGISRMADATEKIALSVAKMADSINLLARKFQK